MYSARRVRIHGDEYEPSLLRIEIEVHEFVFLMLLVEPP